MQSWNFETSPDSGGRGLRGPFSIPETRVDQIDLAPNGNLGSDPNIVQLLGGSVDLAIGGCSTTRNDARAQACALEPGEAARYLRVRSAIDAHVRALADAARPSRRNRFGHWRSPQAFGRPIGLSRLLAGGSRA